MCCAPGAELASRAPDSHSGIIFQGFPLPQLPGLRPFSRQLLSCFSAVPPSVLLSGDEKAVLLRA